MHTRAIYPHGVGDDAGLFSVAISRPSLINNLPCEFGIVVALTHNGWARVPVAVSALRDHVINIVFHASTKKMYRAIALAVVAAMKDLYVFVDRAMDYLIGFAMNQDGLSAAFKDPDASVPVGINIERPLQAWIGMPGQIVVVGETKYGFPEMVYKSLPWLEVQGVKTVAPSAHWMYSSLAEPISIEQLVGKSMSGGDLVSGPNSTVALVILRERPYQAWMIGPLWVGSFQGRNLRKYMRSAFDGATCWFFDKLSLHLPALHWLFVAWPRRYFRSAGPFSLYLEGAWLQPC